MTEDDSSNILRLVKFIVPVGFLGDHSSIKKGNSSNLLLWMTFRDAVVLRSDQQRLLNTTVIKVFFKENTSRFLGLDHSATNHGRIFSKIFWMLKLDKTLDLGVFTFILRVKIIVQKVHKSQTFLLIYLSV